MAISSSSSSSPCISLLFLLLLLAPSLIQGNEADKTIDYHNGPILTGNINVALIWYGRCGRVQKNTIRNFIKSLNGGGAAGSLQPPVSSWWNIVESYQTLLPNAPRGPAPKIIVKVTKQITDVSYKYGKILTTLDYIPMLVQDATNGDPNLLPIIVTARDVTVQGLCTGKCGDHGVTKTNKAYVVVGNPETECPGACAWPFFQSDIGPKGVILQPPNNVAADAMVAALATALADAVTNPQNTGFFNGNAVNPIGPGSSCRGIFGSGAFPGNPGKVHIDPVTGGAFNAHGNRGKKFLLPAVWNPTTSSCWTLM